MSLFVAHKREESLLSNPKTWYTCFTHTKKFVRKWQVKIRF